MNASIFDSALSHTRRSDASEKRRKYSRPLLNVFTCGQVSSPVSVKFILFFRNSARNSVVQNSVGPISDFPDIEEEPPDSHKTLEDPDPNDLELDPGSPRIEYNYKNSPLPITARD